jgi:adenylate cyclase class IV
MEVLLGQDDDEAGGEQEAHAMFARLGVAQTDLVPLAYVDLLSPESSLAR